jgi:amidase
MSNYTLFCFIANGAGLPSASLPLHWNKEGLPIGVLTTAKVGCEDLLFHWRLKWKEPGHGPAGRR